MIQDCGVESVCCEDNKKLVNCEGERRKHRRFTVENMGVDCDMPAASRVKVMNMSSGGVLVMADKFINIGKSYALKIGYKDNSVFVKADVIWALLADCVKQDNGDVIPLFIAGMRFTEVIRGDVGEIMRLLEANMKGNMYDAFMGTFRGNDYDKTVL